MRLMLLLAALLFCGSALAFHCPMDINRDASPARISP